MGVRKSLMRLLVGTQGMARRSAMRMGRLPDRRMLERQYLPAFAALGGRILWIGCRDYSMDYPALLERHGAEVWTTDIDPEQAQWGRPGRHRVGDIREADKLFGGQAFDVLLCNGVLGFGVDSPEDQQRTLAAFSAIHRPGGWLLLGWNTDRIADPIAAGLAPATYRLAPFAGLAARIDVPGVTHVYQTLVREDFPQNQGR